LHRPLRIRIVASPVSIFRQIFPIEITFFLKKNISNPIGKISKRQSKTESVFPFMRKGSKEARVAR
jgi:hypothetical protein